MFKMLETQQLQLEPTSPEEKNLTSTSTTNDNKDQKDKDKHNEQTTNSTSNLTFSPEKKPLRRLRPSDSIHLNCSCSSKASTSQVVILFYFYFSLTNPQTFYQFQTNLIHQLDLYGKVRISKEGVNSTLVGSRTQIKKYVDKVCRYLSQLPIETPILAPDLHLLLNPNPNPFQLNSLTKPESDREILTKLWLENTDWKEVEVVELKQDPFWTKLKLSLFKPSVGACKHIFNCQRTIKLTKEICPFEYSGKPIYFDNSVSETLVKLDPETFHQLLAQLKLQAKERGEGDAKGKLLLDVRNYYESQLGGFHNAVKPEIRNFKGLKGYLKDNSQLWNGKDLVTYCTGGIRCEKATRYIDQVLRLELEAQGQKFGKVFMLEGGIHNYLEWCKAKGLTQDQIHFHGRNYVFDARQSTSLFDLDSRTSHPTSHINSCTTCHQPTSFLYKCTSANCHKLLLRCPPPSGKVESSCFLTQNTCCEDCPLINNTLGKKSLTRCNCELERLARLTGRSN